MEKEPDYIVFNYDKVLKHYPGMMKAVAFVLGSVDQEGRILIDTERPSLKVLKINEILETIQALEDLKFIKEETYGAYIINPEQVIKGPDFDIKKAKSNWKRVNREREIYPGTGEEKYCVYIHYFPNGKYYVGISAHLITRWERKGRTYESNKEMFEAIQKYGWDNIRHRVVCANLTKEEALAIEKTLIRLYGFNKLYNRV